MGFWGVVDGIIKHADILLLVADVRMPKESRNSELERKIENAGKPLILVFTKMDLVEESTIAQRKKEYPEAFVVSGTRNIGIGPLRRYLQILAKKLKLENAQIGIVGYPNIGKSALINALARRARTVVSNKPGTTRGVQWVDVGSLRILDSPGVIPERDGSSQLTLIGSKSPDGVKNPEKIACDIIQKFISGKTANLAERYHIVIPPLTDAYEILLDIGRKRGYIKKGGEVDETKTAITVIRDWQNGKLKI